VINGRVPRESAICSSRMGVYSACLYIVIRFNWKIIVHNILITKFFIYCIWMTSYLALYLPCAVVMLKIQWGLKIITFASSCRLFLLCASITNIFIELNKCLNKYFFTHSPFSCCHFFLLSLQILFLAVTITTFWEIKTKIEWQLL